jgi:predicted helicase
MVRKKGAQPNASKTEIYHRDVWGNRSEKYEHLFTDSPLVSGYQQISPVAPYYFFAPKDFTHQHGFNAGFKLDELFIEFGSGVKFRKDNLLVKNHYSRSDVLAMIDDMNSLSTSTILKKYRLSETKDWTIENSRQYFEKNTKDIQPVNYRPFDKRFCYFPFEKLHFIIPRGDHRRNLMKHMNAGSNIAFNMCRQFSGNHYRHFFVSDCMIDLNSASLQTKEQSYCAPLYLYPDKLDLDQTRRVNFDPKIHNAIVVAVVGGDGGVSGRHPLPPSGRSQKLTPPTQLREKGEVPDEVEIFDYIYGVLHCPAYRETYKEFLKIDFPRVPYPPSPEVFWDVSAKGTELRKLHLMEDAAIGLAPYKFTGAGDTMVGKVKYEAGRVSINDAQGFDGVPEIAWNFYIGGYQPAQKWLKDRKGRELSFEDIKHYQKIIKILSETDRIMKTIEIPL